MAALATLGEEIRERAVPEIADPEICDATRLENVNRWVEADESGYADLVEAVRWRYGC